MLIVSIENNATHIGEVEGDENGVFNVDSQMGLHLLDFGGWRRPTAEESEAYWDENRASDPSPNEVRPGGSASRDAWVAYAIATGSAPEDLEDLSRDEIRDQFKAEDSVL